MTTDQKTRPTNSNASHELNWLTQQVEHLLLAVEHELRVAGPSGLSELALIKALQSDCWQLIGPVDFARPEQLYPVHFLLFHTLYRLSDELLSSGETIQLSPMCIRLFPVHSETGTSLPGPKDALREFYLDLKQYYLSNTDISDMMDRFWAGTIQHKPDSESATAAAELLGFESVPATFDTVKRRFRKLVMQLHPDRGGSTEEVQHLNEAIAVLKAHYA
ncbi:MAG: DNA-J related domain-containing protein [Marinobacter sp.]|uniref:DNA-J related domain-containing protein n=1 Tax=unclassified Marinobacter TaxID=83889 RepID=UPI00273C50D7|nr:DNA-J related domain-containing protein [Marinobacter sp. MDS2]MDP4546585.1 DNA-J related domain-containing protein [Marinobacter sp. MDS2]